MEMVLPQDFKEFLSLLKTKNIPYLLIGGYAVGYHGYPRVTNDIDIWIAIEPKVAEQMVSALKEFGFDTPQLSKDIFLKEKNRVVPFDNLLIFRIFLSSICQLRGQRTGLLRKLIDS